MLTDDLARVDLNALQALVMVQDCQSFSEASQRLGVNQSTISYSVRGLRKAFNDPIFVRQGNSIVSTEKGRQLVQEAREILERMQALSSLRAFDPQTSTGSLTISCNHHERMFLIPAFVHEVHRQAPQVAVNIFESAVHGKQQLKENICDIVLGPVAIFGDIYYRRKLFTDSYACIMDPAHPLADGELTMEGYRQTRHIAVTHNGQWEALYFAALRVLDITITPSVIVPSHDNLEPLIRDTELVATIPYRLARRLSDRLTLKRFPLEVLLQIDMYWTERTHYSGLHAWARQILAEVSAKI
ncbi:LysR family transcriptional regulator [Mesorhizobium sp. L-8-10]|uniref:LysR family transcriptional regulator n=1 Tax=Mesorhizobium sp. L-8-10 TaxID=2744523 RepID=UPI0019382C94|nr:LysR family transcriptional regulator [Mesorhizobium sp. L-8-10]BCH35707.1 LysR family transcriptional regulator [Mesorhizobium sp. L-8-10]